MSPRVRHRVIRTRVRRVDNQTVTKRLGTYTINFCSLDCTCDGMAENFHFREDEVEEEDEIDDTVCLIPELRRFLTIAHR